MVLEPLELEYMVLEPLELEYEAVVFLVSLGFSFSDDQTSSY